MPELPEVQTTISYLESRILGKEIADTTITRKGESHFNKTPEEVPRLLKGARFNSFNRIGKWILIDFGTTKAVAHLRMSGRFLISDTVDPHVHNRFHFVFTDNTVLNYIDQRRFGTFHLFDSFEDHPSINTLGPDALSNEFNKEYLYKQLQKRNKSIYSCLLDQTIIAGLGNIYVNEVLHAISIHPLLPANQVTQGQIKQLVESSKKILNQALNFKGTTLIDNLYQDPEGNDGGFTKMLKVYGKKDDPNIESIKISGRTVFFNLLTQKLR